MEWLLQGESLLVVITLVFIAGDVVSGLLKAAYTGAWSSEMMRKGLLHKSAFVLVMALACVAQWATTLSDSIPFTAPLVVPVCVYIIATELLSIFENLGQCNDKIGELYTIFKNALK